MRDVRKQGVTVMSIEDASRKEFEAWYIHRNGLILDDDEREICFDIGGDKYVNPYIQLAIEAWQAARQTSQSEPVATADYVAYLYRDHNGTLKLAQEVPPPDNAFPVFTTNIRFLDVARLVLDDNVDLILEHGGVKLWEALVTKVNKDYAEKNHE
jgi:hypothetical protein